MFASPSPSSSRQQQPPNQSQFDEYYQYHQQQQQQDYFYSPESRIQQQNEHQYQHQPSALAAAFQQQNSNNNNYSRAQSPTVSFASPQNNQQRATTPTTTNKRFQQQQFNQHHRPTQIEFSGYGGQQQQNNQNKQNNQNNTNISALEDYYREDNKLQKCFQSDIVAAKPLFSARQIATRHLQSGFSLFGGGKEASVLYTERMLQQPQPRARSSGSSVTQQQQRGMSTMSNTNANGHSYSFLGSGASNFSTKRTASSHIDDWEHPLQPQQQQQQDFEQQQQQRLDSVPEQTASPVVIDYHNDVSHGKRTMRAMQLERKQQDRDNAKAFVERNGISILGRMEAQIAAGVATDALPGLMNRKNRSASPSSSHTHIQGMGLVKDCSADGSKFRYSRKVHPDQRHETNLTRALLPIRKIMTPPVEVLASPPRNNRGARVGVRHAIDTNRVLVPDMIPESRQPRLRSLRPPEMLGQGMEIKEGAPQWTWKGGLRGDFWKHNPPTDPFGGEP